MFYKSIIRHFLLWSTSLGFTHALVFPECGYWSPVIEDSCSIQGNECIEFLAAFMRWKAGSKMAACLHRELGWLCPSCCQGTGRMVFHTSILHPHALRACGPSAGLGLRVRMCSGRWHLMDPKLWLISPFSSLGAWQVTLKMSSKQKDTWIF